MLVDFADAIGGNVYTLGGTFIKLCRVLSIQLPLVDPSLYIQRFAAQLGFGAKTLAVANTALRIVQRMGRDWIHTGRRPSGISGASLLIAARMHGFETTPQDIVQVVRVCDSTLRKRLVEFADTNAAAAVTVGQLLDSKPDTEAQRVMESDEGAANPPAFTRALQRDRKEQAALALWLRAQNGEDKQKLLEEERERVRSERKNAREKAAGVVKKEEPVDDDNSGAASEGAKKQQQPAKRSKKQPAAKKEGKDKGKAKGKSKAKKQSKEGEDDDGVLEDVLGAKDGEKQGAGGGGAASETEDEADEPADSVEKEIWDTLQNSEFLTIEHTARRLLDQNARAFALADVNPLAEDSLVNFGADDPAAAAAATATTTSTVDDEAEGAKEKQEEEDALDDGSDSEVDCYINTPEQVELKRRAWEEMYKDYIEEQEQKEQEQKERGGDKAAGSGRGGRGARRNSSGGEGDGTVADGTRRALQNRTSARVNYAALGKLLTLDQEALAKGPLPYEEVRAAKQRAGAEGSGPAGGVRRPRDEGADGAAELSLAQKIARRGDDEDDDDDFDDDDDDDDYGDGAIKQLLHKKQADKSGDDTYFDDF